MGKYRERPLVDNFDMDGIIAGRVSVTDSVTVQQRLNRCLSVTVVERAHDVHGWVASQTDETDQELALRLVASLQELRGLTKDTLGVVDVHVVAEE